MSKFDFDAVRQQLSSGKISEEQWIDLLHVIGRRSGLAIEVMRPGLNVVDEYERPKPVFLDLPTNVTEAMSMIVSALMDGGRPYGYEIDYDMQHNRVLLALDPDDDPERGNGVILTVEFSPVHRQCGLCVMPAKFMVIPDLDEDDGTVAACEQHLDEIAGQFSRPSIEPIQAWSKHVS